MFFRFIFLFSFLIGSFAFARSPLPAVSAEVKSLCEFLLDGQPSTRDQQSILHEARKSFKLVGLERVKDGQRQFLLLAGETHLKFSPGSRRGKNMIALYSRYGLENANMTNSIPMRIAYPIHEVVRWTIMTFLRVKDTSLKDAKNHALANPETHSYLPLEEGHVPDFREKLELLKAPAIFGLVFIDHHLQGSANYGIYSTLLTLPSIYFFAEIMLAWKHHTKKWYQKVFPTAGGILIGRNETMIQNLLPYVDANLGKDTLVIVGAGHVPGLSTILTERHGFSPVDLSGLR